MASVSLLALVSSFCFGAVSPHGVQVDAMTLNSRQIKEVQRDLNQLGYHAGPVDGIWGIHTGSAVRRFQQKEKLAPTGLINRNTLAALKRRSNRQEAGTSSRGVSSNSQGSLSLQAGQAAPTFRGRFLHRHWKPSALSNHAHSIKLQSEFSLWHSA